MADLEQDCELPAVSVLPLAFLTPTYTDRILAKNAPIHIHLDPLNWASLDVHWSECWLPSLSFIMVRLERISSSLNSIRKVCVKRHEL